MPKKTVGRVPFEVETDVSEFAITATLNQKGHPVLFFYHILQRSEIMYSSVEKEAQAIIEVNRNWKHYLTGKLFLIKTDQHSVAYMFNTKQREKIINDKNMCWEDRVIL